MVCSVLPCIAGDMAASEPATPPRCDDVVENGRGVASTNGSARSVEGDAVRKSSSGGSATPWGVSASIACEHPLLDCGLDRRRLAQQLIDHVPHPLFLMGSPKVKKRSMCRTRFVGHCIGFVRLHGVGGAVWNIFFVFQKMFHVHLAPLTILGEVIGIIGRQMTSSKMTRCDQLYGCSVSFPSPPSKEKAHSDQKSRMEARCVFRPLGFYIAHASGCWDIHFFCRG